MLRALTHHALTGSTPCPAPRRTARPATLVARAAAPNEDDGPLAHHAAGPIDSVSIFATVPPCGDATLLDARCVMSVP